MKKVVRIVAWVIGIVVVVLFLGALALQLFFPADRVRRYAEEEGSRVLGRPVSIESLDVSFLGGLGISLRNVAVGNPPGLTGDSVLTADEVDVKLQLFPLLSSEFLADRVIVNNPILVLHKYKDGTVNYLIESAAVDSALPPEVKEMPAETRSAATVVSFDRLEINDGSLTYIDDSSGVGLALRGFDLSTSLTIPREGYYESNGKLDTDTILVTIDEQFPAYALSLTYNAGFDWASQRLMLENSNITINGLRMECNGSVDSVFGQARAMFHLKSDQVDVLDVFSLLPASQRALLDDYKIDGQFSLVADIDYDATREDNPLVYTGIAEVGDLTMSSKQIPGDLVLKRALIDFKPDNARLAIENGQFDGRPLKGHLVVDNFEDPKISGELAGDFNLIFLEPFLPAENEHKLSGRTRFEVTFSGHTKDPESFDFSGTLAVSEGKYASLLLPEPMDNLSLDVYFDRTLVNVRSFKGSFPSGDISFTGRIDNLLPYMLADSAAPSTVSPALDGKVKGKINLAMMNRFLPERGSPELAGILGLDLKLVGSLSALRDFRPVGTVTISGASYRDSLLPEPITDFASSMKLARDTIIVDSLRVKFETSDVRFSGTLIKPFPYLLPIMDLDRSKLRRPMFLFSLSSGRFDIDRLFPEAVPGSQTEGGGEVSIDSVSIVFVPDIDGQGDLKFDTLIYNKMEFTGATGQVKIRDRKITCYDLKSDLYEGKVVGDAVIDLNDFENPTYTGSFTATQVEVNQILSRYSKLGGYLFGKMNLNGEYNASGWEPEDFLGSLTMTGRGDMKEGKLITTGKVYDLLNQLSSLTGEPVNKEQILRDLGSRIRVEDGKVILDNLKTKLGDIGDFELGGFYGFDGTVGYNGSMLLSKPLTQKLLAQGGLVGGLAGLFNSDSVDRIKLPLKITGTVDEPKAEVDTEALQKAAGQNVLKDAGDLLQGLFKKKKP